MWTNILTHLHDYISPPRCIGCAEAYTWLCRSCRLGLGEQPTQHCSGCGSEHPQGKTCALCRALDCPLGQLVSAYTYENRLVHRLLATYKEQGNRIVGQLLAQDFARRVAVCLSIGRDTDIVAVPASARAVRERGFNQTEHLAECLARKLHCSVVTPLGKRNSRHKQKELSRSARRASLKDVFYLKTKVRVPAQVLLVDDVATTLSTLETCAMLLKQAGTRQVSAVVLAHAVH